MKKIYFLLSFILFYNLGFSQKKHFEIQWDLSNKNLKKNIRPDAYLLFSKEHYFYSTQNIYYTDVWRDNLLVDSSSVKIINVKKSIISGNIVRSLSIQQISKTFKVQLKSSYARNNIYTTLKINTIIKQNGIYYKLDSFDIIFNYKSENKKAYQQYIYDSKWNSGDWYRFKIQKSGIYKIDKNFLKSLGIDVANLDPRKIKILGNGAKLIPLPNNSFFPDDIQELAIQVIGEQDGRFDDSDYILFYAQGPEWSAENDTNLNIYTNNFYYFIQIDDHPGKRMQAYTIPSGNVQHSFNTYTAYKYYEKDETNFTNMGRKFYEKSFSSQSKSVSFTFKNIDLNKPVHYRVSAASNYGNTTGFSTKLNGQFLGSVNFDHISNIIVGSEKVIEGNTSVNSGNLEFVINHNDGGNFDAKLYLNYINVQAYCELKGHQKQFVFFNKEADNLGSGIGEYQLSNASNISQIWDITNIYNPAYILNNQSNINIKFNLQQRKRFIALDKNDIYLPIKPNVVKIKNQNLHKDVFYHTGNFQDLDMLIITPSFLHHKAEELADMHRAIGQNTFVADLNKIYNEFGTGSQDIVAIRNFVRYVYRNASAPDKRVKYLLMFGDASIDYKGILSEYEITNGERTNLTPVYEALNGFNLVSSYASDDYFVLMDANEGNMGGAEQPDIAVGRFIIRDEQDADVLINKYKHYFSQTAMKPWRNFVTLWSDDWDRSGDNFVVNVENTVASGIKQYHPEVNIDKIYMDAYVQEQTPGGGRYPQAKRDLLNRFEKGSLLIGYIGHGNELVLTHERMLEMNDVLRMRNYDRLPVFTTLTCEFGRYDNPRAETTAEHMLWNSRGGALALVTTVREIWVNSADLINILFYKNVFGTSPNLSGQIEYNPAEALRKAKLSIGTYSKYIVSFLGDPGFEMALPHPKIVMTQINNQPTDTIKALQKVKIEGEIRDENNTLLTNFNGNVYPIIFDKNQQKQTLNNDGQGQIINFEKLGRTIFKGKTTAVDGKFSFEFVVPRDINIAYGQGRISFYGENGELEKSGYNESIIVGGIDPQAGSDNDPPKIKAYMNDTNFVDGGITDSNPYLLLHLSDENGINTVGGVGHDITAVLDDNISDVYILNDFYEADPNTYKSGKVRYRLVDLEPGWHTIKIKAWDVYNNSSTAEIKFQVVSENEIKIEKVLNYPNPFVNYTEFWFTHNHPYEELDVMVQVYTITGKLVWQHRQNVYTTGFLSRDISWDGKDNFGNKLAKGVYVYKISVRSLKGKTAKKIEKLVKL